MLILALQRVEEELVPSVHGDGGDEIQDEATEEAKHKQRSLSARGAGPEAEREVYEVT
ncbi:hypothetical protein [Methylocystis parvus]|uniref:hypothetical protein n=1 Tax=Methylocystis parvus TaxID=134 RepID=UPI001FD1C84F|nr:hypothetical protein [Methylocystis parvus]WBK02168.1 hypothetical protein MMG94_12325 [Methylocystis parvus OBBP]